MINNIDYIRQYKDSIAIHFKGRGENFTLNVPHKNKWNNVISYFKRRGFKIGENKYYKEEYTLLSPYHKSGRKGEVGISLELNSASISINFGHIKNMWDDNKNFWDDWHDKHIKLTYLENKRVTLEIHKLLQYLSKWGFYFKPSDDSLTDTEKIIQNNRNNTHVHGDNINCLEDIGKYITKDSYDYRQNSNDKNKKKIICGDVKYFYDRYETKRLMRGVAYHNINNMWWVMVNGKRRNIVCWDLFDYSADLPKRKQLNEQESVQRWRQEITKAERKRNYKKAEALWKKIDNFTLYNVWSLKNNKWFRPGSSGYTSRQEEAGVYTKTEIDSNLSYYDNKRTTEAILIEK